MSNSDDNYFTDDLVLDDKTVALLNEEESKFRRTTNPQTQATQQSVGPPPKRQKTTSSRQLQSASNTIPRANTLDDDLPDVTIRQDGTYGLRDKQRRASGPPSRTGIAPGPNVVVQAGSGTRPTATASVSRCSVPPVRRISAPGPARPTSTPSRPPSAARGPRIGHSPAPSQEISRSQSGPAQRVNRFPPPSNTAAPNNYVQQLLQQIEELRKENEVIQASMESARDAKFAKEGEVTILRKRMEKTAHDHLAQIAKLKAAKEEADAKHVVLQKEYEVEKERLRTELTFRRHELEASRKHAVILSPNNIVSQSADTMLFQKQRSSQWGSAGPSRLALEMPHRPRFGDISDFGKPKKTTVPETRDLPSGFQTGHPRSQLMMGRKGKEPAPPPNSPPVFPRTTGGRLTPSQNQHDVFGSQIDDAGPMEDFAPPVYDRNEDVHMVDEGTPAMSLSTQENTTVLAFPSWNLLLHDIMLTHTLQGSKFPTLQLLMCPSPAGMGQVQSYGTALMRIFDVLGGVPTHPEEDFDDLAQSICCALCEIAELLAKNNWISSLTAVLNLLANLAYTLPPIHVMLLSQPFSNDDKTPRLLGLLHKIIQDQLQRLDLAAGNESSEICLLGKETLFLYEALVWWIPDDLGECLSACPSMSSLLTTLLHPHRPPWFLISSMRVLLWLSTRRNLFRSLLSHAASGRTGNNGEFTNVDHPHIALVCSLLTDTDRQGPEADELKSRIIMFFGMLSNAHSDAYALLVESQELIPSVVLYLCHLASPIWDENEVILNDLQATTRMVHIINHAILLLHHLVLGGDATLDLRERLLHTPSPAYQGLIHRFILTFGRLSYANPPYWLDEDNRQRLIKAADLARTLLERVIQGPELDLIWATYQDLGDGNETAMDVDDEEVEAQKIAN